MSHVKRRKLVAKAVIENIPEDWEPDIGLAEDILLRYWRGEFPQNTTTPTKP